MDQDDLTRAEMCRVAYTKPPDYQLGDARVHVFHFSGRPCLVFEGTKPMVLLDVIRDLQFLPVADVTLGPWADGFLRDVRAAQYALLHDFYDQQVELVGHSKGGAEAAGMAAVYVAVGRPPARLTTYGCPRCCGDVGRGLLAGVSGVTWWQRGDPVPDLGMLGLPRDPTQFGPDVLIDDQIENHFIENYIKGGAEAG